ncbi:hypothetical protein GW7_17055, partial [Heterocephalus glaber]
YASTMLFVTMALQYIFKLDIMMSPALFFLLRIPLAILGLFWIYINFRIAFLSSSRTAIGILIGIALNL